jgi:putative membrane protein
VQRDKLKLMTFAICLIFALYTVWSGLFPGALPGGIDGLVLTVLLVAFALIHGAERYGWSSILVYVIICLVVSNVFENLSILTGFPFGHYYYTDVLGPKLFLVPMLIGGAYTGVGYLSWIIAHVLLERMGPNSRSAILALPVVGAVLMVSWDLSLDPGASTIGKAWIWIDGGAFFGVPIQNFFGWYLTVFFFLALFSWYQSTRPICEVQSRNFWARAIIMYFFLGFRYPLTYARSTDSGEVTDPSGHIWNTSDISATAALLSVYTMMAFALIAWLRLRHRTKDTGVALF